MNYICRIILKLPDMHIKEITRDVYYAGVNDRVTSLFEGLWPLS